MYGKCNFISLFAYKIKTFKQNLYVRDTKYMQSVNIFNVSHYSYAKSACEILLSIMSICLPGRPYMKHYASH